MCWLLFCPIRSGQTFSKQGLLTYCVPFAYPICSTDADFDDGLPQLGMSAPLHPLGSHSMKIGDDGDRAVPHHCIYCIAHEREV